MSLLCPSNQLGTWVFCKVRGKDRIRPSESVGMTAKQPLLISRPHHLLLSVCNRMPSSMFTAIFGYPPGTPTKGSLRILPGASRSPLAGGAPGAAQEAPCPEAPSPSLLRPRRRPAFPLLWRLPYPDRRVGVDDPWHPFSGRSFL